MNGADDAHAIAVLLHPHPHFGGDRFHPFVDGLFRRLPGGGVSAVRFDFSSADPDTARDEVVSAVDDGAARWPGLPVVLVGYSFGAGVAARVDDDRVAGWHLLAPQATSLAESIIGHDQRPKIVAVPAHDQFSPPDAVDAAVATWTATSVTVVDGADHFLASAMGAVVDAAYNWVTTTALR